MKANNLVNSNIAKKLAEIGLNWPKLAKMAKNGQNSTLYDSCQVAHQTKADDVVNSKIEKNWAKLALLGPNWPRMAKNDQNAPL